jgi:molecular chaperone IbpA
LAEHMNVHNADLDNGILNIELKLEIPEELKPTRIEL